MPRPVRNREQRIIEFINMKQHAANALDSLGFENSAVTEVVDCIDADAQIRGSFSFGEVRAGVLAPRVGHSAINLR